MAQDASTAAPHAMTVTDLLELEAVDAAAVDSDGSAVALVVQRARRAGEPTAGEGLYGGNVRGDVVVFSAATGQVVMRTSGASEHAGYWHPVWSPTGRYLAMLALHGDALAVCVWHRNAGAVACRPGDRSLDYLTQISVGVTQGGSRSLDSPFLWLSDSTLMFGVLPKGDRDHAAMYSHRTADSLAVTWARERRGKEPSISVLDTPWPAGALSASAEIRVWNVAQRTTRTVFRVPYFTQGFRNIVLSPERDKAAVLADQYQAARNPSVPFGFHNHVRTALGVVDLTRAATVWWTPPHPYTRFARWASDGDRLGVMAKRSDDENVVRGTRLFVVDVARQTVDSVITDSPTDSVLRWTVGGDATTASPRTLASGDHLLTTAPNGTFSIVRRLTRAGTSVWQVPASGVAPRLLLSLNARLRRVTDATRMLIAYTARDGSVQRGAVLLPPGFKPGVRYPLITWVYPGLLYADTLDGLWLRAKDDPFPLNPNILAGHGYVVLFPSMPLVPNGVTVPTGEVGDPYAHMLDGISAALDTMVARGMADSTRLGIIGQSYGGYAVNCIVSQSHRFRAAVSLAGVADLTSGALQFVSSSRYTDFPALSLPWAETGQGRMGNPPWRDPARYVRNSPITYVDSVHVPILLADGDNDYIEQAEEWFTALHRAGKRARFVRYWGGAHMLYSPADIEHLWGEILTWFDSYLPSSRVNLHGRAPVGQP